MAKLKQTEVDCEYLKRWCERLADENKRLEKELADLRALKAAAPSPVQPASPAATLTMCPSCHPRRRRRWIPPHRSSAGTTDSGERLPLVVFYHGGALWASTPDGTAGGRDCGRDGDLLWLGKDS